MEDTCLFAESLCYILQSQPTSIPEFLQELEVEAYSITLGDLQPNFQCLPLPTVGVCPMIRLFPVRSQPFNPLDLNKDITRLQSAGLFRLHVCRLANDAIRDWEVPYEQVRGQVSDIAKKFDLDLWGDFDFWRKSLTQPNLEELQKCLADAPTSQQPSEFSHMLNLPEPFLKEVFNACKHFEEVDAFTVRRMLDECGRYYCKVLQEELIQLCEQSLKGKENREFTYWKQVYAYSCLKPFLKESEAQDLAQHIYVGCTELEIDCHILIGQGSVWVFVLVKERLSRQKRAKITKVFDEFIHSRRETQLSWMFAGRPEERSPFILPSGLRQVLDFLHLMVGEELPNWLVLNVRNIRQLVLDCLRRRNKHVELWQLRIVSGSRDLCDDDWVKDTSSLRILVCEDWTQWEDSVLKNLVLEIASHLPTRRKECALVERKTCAPLAYLCQTLKVLDVMDPYTLLPGLASDKIQIVSVTFLDCPLFSPSRAIFMLLRLHEIAMYAMFIFCSARIIKM